MVWVGKLLKDHMNQKRQVNKHANASYNVANLEQSLKFYTEVLGMKLRVIMKKVVLHWHLLVMAM